jgi:hypothetical protein
MATTSSTTLSPPAPASSSDALFTEQQRKKGTLIFLTSCGVTLLVTGLTGSTLLRRLQKKCGIPGASTTTTPVSAGRRRLKDISPVDFYSNRNLPPKGKNSGFLAEIAGAPLSAQEAQAAAKDGFNPAIYAAKALGIATAITFTTFGLGLWAAWRKLEADSVRLSLSLFGLLFHHPIWKAIEKLNVCDFDFIARDVRLSDRARTPPSGRKYAVIHRRRPHAFPSYDKRGTQEQRESTGQCRRCSERMGRVARGTRGAEPAGARGEVEENARVGGKQGSAENFLDDLSIYRESG